MNCPALLAVSPSFWDTLKTWGPAFTAGCFALLTYFLTRHSGRADKRQVQATEVEHLYIGSAKDLILTLQEELRSRNLRVGALEKEREQLRANLSDERQMLEIVKQRHRDLVAFLTNSGIKVPDDVHL